MRSSWVEELGVVSGSASDLRQIVCDECTTCIVRCAMSR